MDTRKNPITTAGTRNPDTLQGSSLSRSKALDLVPALEPWSTWSPAGPGACIAPAGPVIYQARLIYTRVNLYRVRVYIYIAYVYTGTGIQAQGTPGSSRATPGSSRILLKGPAKIFWIFGNALKGPAEILWGSGKCPKRVSGNLLEICC